MSDWSAGYVIDTGYTYGYYEDMNPIRVQYILNYLGYPPVAFEKCFELGIGQGISVNIHSLTSDADWFGNDFNPDQVVFARELAKITGANLTDQSFEDVSEDETLPNFDFICLHGIWSWISHENREKIVKFCERRLNVGGVLYISYNTCPGHNPMVPVRSLMLEYAQSTVAKGASAESKIETAFSFLDRLQAIDAKYFEVNSILKDRLKGLKDKPRNYIAHEYFNRDWAPMDVTETGKYLESAKLKYVTSTDYIQQIRYVNFSKEQLELLETLDNNLFAEKVGDYITNSQFRKDLWIKGGERVSQHERLQNLKHQNFVLIEDSEDFEFTLTGQKLTANLQKTVYEPIIDMFKKKKILSNAEIFEALKSEVTLLSVCEATMILCAKKAVVPARSLDDAKSFHAKCKEYNLHITELTKFRHGLTTLASPVTGGGVIVSKFSQVFANYILTGNKKYEADTLADYAHDIIKSSNQKIQSKGKVLEEDSDAIEYLRDAAKSFLDQELPRLKMLMVL